PALSVRKSLAGVRSFDLRNHFIPAPNASRVIEAVPTASTVSSVIVNPSAPGRAANAPSPPLPYRKRRGRATALSAGREDGGRARRRGWGGGVGDGPWPRRGRSFTLTLLRHATAGGPHMRRLLPPALLLGALLLPRAAGPASDPPGGPADVILVHGKVWTVAK